MSPFRVDDILITDKGAAKAVWVRMVKKKQEMKMLGMKRFEFQYVTDEAGKKTAVILPIEEFRELLEDIEDLAAVAERRDEPSISHDELLAELKQDGLL